MRSGRSAHRRRRPGGRPAFHGSTRRDFVGLRFERGLHHPGRKGARHDAVHRDLGRKPAAEVFGQVQRAAFDAV